MTVVYDWLRRRYTPSPQALQRFLETHGIDKTPYQDLLVLPYQTLVCPVCGRRRQINRSQLPVRAARVQGRTLPRRADGSYELLCRSCSNRSAHHLARLRRASNTALKQTLKKRFPADVEMGDRAETLDLEDPQIVADRKHLRVEYMLGGRQVRRANQEKFKRMVRNPRTEAARQAIALGAIGHRHGRITKPFYLCPLCDLVIVGFRWHRPCSRTWWGYVRRTLKRYPRPGEMPLARNRRQHSPEKYLRRNYGWLIARRKMQTRKELLLPALVSRTTVTKGIQAFVRHLPGSWDLVFTKRRARNRGRQKLVLLPYELAPLIEAGQRDPLIRRLAGYGMKDEDIAHLTGAKIHRVRGVILREKAETEKPA